MNETSAGRWAISVGQPGAASRSLLIVPSKPNADDLVAALLAAPGRSPTVAGRGAGILQVDFHGPDEQ